MRTLKFIVPLIFTGMVLVACEPSAIEQPAAPVADTPAASGPIANTELQARIVAANAPLILDVRGADEYAGGHIAGAINIPHSDVGARLSELPADRSTEIVVHCQSGRRAAQAEADLTDAGYTNVRHLDGDYAGWKAAGLPLQ